MKIIRNITLGIWCGITCFVSPIWLSIVWLNITGLIYQYDYSMDEGTAIVIGAILLIVWILLALLPNIVFMKAMYAVNRKYFCGLIVLVVLLCVAFF